MSRRVLKKSINSIKSINFFPNPLVQGKYPVLPPPSVPPHIIRPDYVTSKNPVFGEYGGRPVTHGPQAIQKLRKAALVASKALQDTKDFILSKAEKRQPLTQQDIDRFVFNSIIEQGAYPTPIGFMGFPKSVCVSVNECYVHGIPSTRPLDLGDKINIDISVFIDGHHGDNNLTVFYGQPQHQVKLQVAQVTQQALYQAISICKPGVLINQIGKAIQRVAKANRLHVCEGFTGHGVGHLLHMSPAVFHCCIHLYYPQYREVMKVGNVFTIEPILTLYPLQQKSQVWADNFTAISHNNPNAQFQHTILIVEGGCQILTKRPSEVIPNPNSTIKNI